MVRGIHNEGRKVSAIIGQDIRKIKFGVHDLLIFNLLRPKLNIINPIYNKRLIKEARKDKLWDRADYKDNNFEMRHLREKYLRIIRCCEIDERNQIIRLLRKLEIPYESMPSIAIERITQREVLSPLEYAENGGYELSVDEMDRIRKRCYDISESVEKHQAKSKYSIRTRKQ